MRRRKPRQEASSGSARGPFFKSIPVSQLTDKERKDWVVALGERARSELADALAEVEALTARMEPFRTLTVMASYALMRFVTRDNSREGVTPEVQQGHVEFLQAMYLRLPPSTLLSPSTPDDIQVLFDQLPRLFAAQHQARLPTRESVDKPVTADEGALRIVQEYLRAHTTVVRNWGYFSSVTRITGELLSGIDQQFTARYGLAASDVVKLFEHLVRRQEKRVSDHWARVQEVLRLATVNEMVDAFFARFPFDGKTAETAAELKREALTTRRLKTALLPMADQYLAAEFFFASDQIAQETRLPPAAVEGLLRKLSLSFGALTNTPVDRLFLNNPVWLRPLIALDTLGQYFCALPQTLLSFVYPIVDELVKPHSALAERLSDVRSDFLEKEVERLLKVAFPGAEVVPGFK